jgi:hypothetical protein
MVKLFLALVALLGLAGTGVGVALLNGQSVGPVTASAPMGVTVLGFSLAMLFVLVASFTERRVWMVAATLCVATSAVAGAMGVLQPILVAAVALGCLAMLIAILTKPTDIAGSSKKGP